MGKWTRSGRRGLFPALGGGDRLRWGGLSASFIILGSSCSVQIFQLFRIYQNTPHLLRELPHWGRIFALVADYNSPPPGERATPVAWEVNKKPVHIAGTGFCLSRQKLHYCATKPVNIAARKSALVLTALMQ